MLHGGQVRVSVEHTVVCVHPLCVNLACTWVLTRRSLITPRPSTKPLNTKQLCS